MWAFFRAHFTEIYINKILFTIYIYLSVYIFIYIYVYIYLLLIDWPLSRKDDTVVSEYFLNYCFRSGLTSNRFPNIFMMFYILLYIIFGLISSSSRIFFLPKIMTLFVVKFESFVAFHHPYSRFVFNKNSGVLYITIKY